MLKVNGIDVYYGKVQALFDISIEVGENEIVSIIGANGAGKTTLMKSIMGINKPKKGSIEYNGTIISGLPVHKVVEKKIVYVPEGREKQKAGSMSGGEQQMLAIARGLMSKPQLLMLDEPSLGLAPVIVDDMFDVIVQINETKKIPIVLVEQNAFMAMSISNRTYVLEVGNLVASGPSKELMDSDDIKKAYLGG